MAWLSGWNHRKQIDVQYDNIDTSVTHFPLMVSFTNDTDIGADVRSDGYDIRFTTSDGETTLNYERVYWDLTGSNASGVFYVSASSWTLSSSGATTFYIYYGKSDATDGENRTAVWDSDYQLVCHTYDLTATTLRDSTGNNTIDKKGSGEPNEVTGTLYLAQEYDATDDYCNFNSASAIDDIFNGGGSFEAWLKADTLGEGDQGYVMRKAVSTGYEMYMGQWADSDLLFRKDFDPTFGRWYIDFQQGTARHVVITYDDSSDSNLPTFYVNGTTATRNTANTPSGSRLGDDTADLVVGSKNTSGTNTFDGTIEEVRLSSKEREDYWIKFEYYNMTSGDNELTWYSEEDAETGIQISINECKAY